MYIPIMSGDNDLRNTKLEREFFDVIGATFVRIMMWIFWGVLLSALLALLYCRYTGYGPPAIGVLVPTVLPYPRQSGAMTLRPISVSMGI